jgi:hypothetical protein
MIVRVLFRRLSSWWSRDKSRIRATVICNRGYVDCYRNQSLALRVTIKTVMLEELTKYLLCLVVAAAMIWSYTKRCVLQAAAVKLLLHCHVLGQQAAETFSTAQPANCGIVTTYGRQECSIRSTRAQNSRRNASLRYDKTWCTATKTI